MNHRGPWTHENIDDSATLRDPQTREAMHSSIGAWLEANTVYVGQSRLASLAGQAGPPITLYDLGLGIGANALAALSAYHGIAEPKRGLRILSFESELSGIRQALNQGNARFPFLAGFEVILQELLLKRAWRSPEGDVEWTLHEGDFASQDLLPHPPADLIFFDFYSPKATPKLWGPALFAKLRLICPSGLLITYSAATRVRAAMLLAGWYVGEGEPTTLKTQTTVAESRPGRLTRPLGRPWLEKFERSGAKRPYGYAPDDETLLSALKAHSQFC